MSKYAQAKAKEARPLTKKQQKKLLKKQQKRGRTGQPIDEAALAPKKPLRNKLKYNNKKGKYKVHSTASENKPVFGGGSGSGAPAAAAAAAAKAPAAAAAASSSASASTPAPAPAAAAPAPSATPAATPSAASPAAKPKKAKLAAPKPTLTSDADVERIAEAALKNAPAASGDSKKKDKKDKKRKASASLTPAEAARSNASAPSASASLLNAPADLDFPRGGGSSLTPLEYRQTLREARAEAAAEDGGAEGPGGELFQEGGKKSKKGKGKGRASDADAARPSKKSKTSASAGGAESSSVKGESVRVEHLNYKRIAPGARLLCTVLAVHPLAIVLSLPNQLLGHVPITNVSETFTQRLEQIAEDDDSEYGSELEEDDSGDEDSSHADQTGDLSSASHLRPRAGKAAEIPELREMYAPGQFVIASVVAVAGRGERIGGQGQGREGGEYERESRRVVLSLDPKLVNAGVELLGEEGDASGDVAKGYMLPVTIKSKEDNGWVVDLGIDAGPGASVAAFVPFKETPLLPAAGPGAAPQRYQPSIGQVLPAAVKSVKLASSRVAVQLSVLPEALAKASLGATAAPSLSALIPGLLVNALVTAVGNTGLGVKLWGLFDATIDRSHLPSPPKGKEFKDMYRLGAHVTARILWDQGPSHVRRSGSRGRIASLGDEDDSDADSLADGLLDSEQERKIGLSAAEHVVKFEPPATLASVMPIGTLVEATVLGCDAEWGLNVQVKAIEGDGSTFSGFVHISRVSDDHITRLTVSTGPYKLGSVHRARVTGHALTDRLVLLSMQESILSKTFMRVSQVQVGDVIRATVKEVRPTGIFLDLGGNVDGVVFPLHFSDIVLKKPEKKYKPGMKVNAKVILVEPSRNRISLTLKKTIVGSELPALSSLQDARAGLLTHATVSKVLDGTKGLLVDFLGGLRALVPASEASETQLADLRTQFYEGKPVMVRLTQVDYASERIFASIRQALPSFQARLNIDAVELGNTVDAQVAAIHQDVVVLTLSPSNVRALLSLSILAALRKQRVDEVRATLEEGEEIKDLVVVSKNAEKGIVIVGPPDSASAQALKKGQGASIGAVVNARIIRESEPCAVQVLLPGKVRGRLHLLDCSDDLSAAKLPALDSMVPCAVLGPRRGGAHVDVSTRASVLEAAKKETPGLASIGGVASTVNDIELGSKVSGFVKAIADHGLFIDIGRDVTARVKIAELFDGFVKEWKSKFAVGQLVRGTVTEVDNKTGKVELSLKTGSNAKEQSSVKKTTSLADFEPGQKVNGFIRGISEFGVFVQIEGTQISGLCHKSELADSAAADDALRSFKIGDVVKAKILEVSAEKNRISFGLKPSYFTVADFAGATAPVDAEDEVMEEAAGSDEDDEEDEEQSSDDEEEDDDASVDGEEDDFLEADSDMSADEPAALPPLGDGSMPRLELAGGFSWSGANNAPGSASEDDDEDSDEEASSKRVAKSKKRAAQQAAQDITAELATKTPESSTDFERVLLGSPNSSFIWIQFMSFYLQLADIDRAREVARRALKIINFREEQERLNVWIALLNLENSYGTEESLEKVLKEAAAANDAKTIYLRMVQIFERSDKIEQADELWRKTIKKFGQSSKVWVLYGQFLLRQRRAEEARQLIPRSMQSLEKRKHVKTVTAFALSEFKAGDPERGRTIFEGLLDTYPKRLDIWLQYIDQESRLIAAKHAAGSLAIVRELFQRVMSLRQSTKKGKSVLKKWLEFEKRQGTQQGQQAVLEKARAFVEQTRKGKDAGGSEDSEADE